MTSDPHPDDCLDPRYPAFERYNIEALTRMRDALLRGEYPEFDMTCGGLWSFYGLATTLGLRDANAFGFWDNLGLTQQEVTVLTMPPGWHIDGRYDHTRCALALDRIVSNGEPVTADIWREPEPVDATTAAAEFAWEQGR